MLSAGFMAYVSVVDEALHYYNLSRMFELIGEGDLANRARFEDLTRRDDEFIQVAGIGRVIGFMLHYAGWVVFIGPKFSSFIMMDLMWAAVLAIVCAIISTVIVPPLIIRHKYEATLLSYLPGFRLAALPLKPITAIGTVFRKMGARIEGVKAHANAEESFHNELADRLEEGAMEGVVDDEQREMIHNVVELGKAPAARAMVPRTDMACASLEDGLENAIKLAIDNGHARVPVFQGSRDKIVGILFVRDLMASYGHDKPRPELADVMRKPRFWPESITLANLLDEMRKERVSIGVLVDEHGGTAGLITLEDIIEEIVGDIRDEFDRDETKKHHASFLPFNKQDDAEADGDVDLDVLNRELGLSLPESTDYNSLAGLVIQRLGHMPGVGESVEIDHLRLTVLVCDDRRIKRVKLTRIRVESETDSRAS